MGEVFAGEHTAEPVFLVLSVHQPPFFGDGVEGVSSVPRTLVCCFEH